MVPSFKLAIRLNEGTMYFFPKWMFIQTTVSINILDCFGQSLDYNLALIAVLAIGSASRRW
jgi:hypothetical protein